MTEQAPTLLVLEDTDTDLDKFARHLAAYCSQYVMEIAKPIMEHTEELFEDKAIVRLVDMWYEADRQYAHRRESYLVQWYTGKANGYEFEPVSSYKWSDEERRAYGQTLRALLVR